MAKPGKRKLSAAAKKGWATRRRNNPELAAKHRSEVLKRTAKHASRKDPETNAIVKEATRRLLEKAGIVLPKRISQVRLNEIFQDFIALQHQETETAKLRGRQDVEAAESRGKIEIEKAHALIAKATDNAVLDTLKSVADRMPDGWVHDEYQVIRARMSEADISGDPSEMAEILADEYNRTPSEIFTIWLSP